MNITLGVIWIVTLLLNLGAIPTSRREKRHYRLALNIFAVFGSILGAYAAFGGFDL